MITGGCSGWLGQEFCDLEILDEITRPTFHSQLAPEINGHHRNTLIRQFRTWKGLNYVPDNLHPTIKWSAQYLNPLEADAQDIPWQIVNRKEKLNSDLNHSMVKTSNSFTAAKGSVPLLYNIITLTGTKRKANDHDELHAIKKLKTSHISSKENEKMRMGQTDQTKNKN